jgi:SAM-dependent methyltransferase
MKLKTTVALLLTAFFSLTAFAQEESVKPGINEKFLDPGLKAEEWTVRFETESREVFLKKDRIVKAVGIQTGMTIADIGAGTGLFTIPFSAAVGESGKVFAVDIAKNFLEHIRTRSAEAGIKNIEPVLCTDHSLELPEASIDLAFICDTYHHFEFPHATMTSLHRALKPGGEFVLIDFKRIDGESSDWTLNHVRAGQEVFEKEILESGFEKVSEVNDFLTENYFVRFRKK